jgi:hypothetical protein
MDGETEHSIMVESTETNFMVDRRFSRSFAG